MQAPHRSVFAVRIPFLLPNQQRQSTESRKDNEKNKNGYAQKQERMCPFLTLTSGQQ